MADQAADKVVIMATHGPEDKERATLPFVMATAAQVMDCEAVVILQGTGVLLAQKGVYDHIFAGGLPPLKDLFERSWRRAASCSSARPASRSASSAGRCSSTARELIAGARVIQEVTTA